MTNKSIHPKSYKRNHELGILIKVGKQTIGQVYNGVLEKDISSKKHFLHYPEEAIAFTITALHAAQAAGAVYVEVLDTDTGTRYKTTLSKYFDLGEKFNYGWGEQIKLTLPNFTQTRGDNDPNSAQTQTPPPDYSDPSGTGDIMPLYYKSNAPTGVTVNGVKQLGLFGGENE